MARRRKTYRENNRIIAGLLAFVGGTFGIHRFYLNDAGGGIFYIVLFFITMKFFPVTMILGIIEALRLFNMDPDEFDKKYNQGKLPDRERRWRQNTRSEYRRKQSDKRREPMDARSRSSSRSNRSQGRPSSSRYVKKKTSIPRRNPFKTSAMDKYKEFELEEAIVDFNKALKIAEKDPEIHFHLAAAYSLTEQKEKAFKHLDLAVQYGLKTKEKIDSFEDLAFVRIQEEYDAFKENGYRIASAKKTKKVENAPKEEAEAVLDDDILLSQLNKLAELRKKGLISEEEFLIEKEKLIEHK
jgi:TM2 domain-containing membrane protein YozV